MRFLIREHLREPLAGNVLTLGRQCVYETFQEVCDLLREEGVRPHRLPPDTALHTNIPQWRGTAKEQFTSDVVFFQLLGGAEVLALDYSDFEGAELVADLNVPVSEQWHGRFDVIVDSGTLEHIFHIPQALANVGNMLRVGGRVVHLSPANNFVNHGFYQFSPTLFADFYRANGFAEVRVFVAEERDFRSDAASLAVYSIGDHQPDLMMSRRRLMTLVIARKTSDSTVARVPMQGVYARLLGPAPAAGEATGATRAAANGALWKRLIPTAVKTLARRWVPGMSPYFRPWRLKLWGKLR